MKKIIYYVASSLDGFIAGIDDDISMFISEGTGVNKYLTDLQDFKTVIMGRRTYEFGYRFGLQPGMPAYPHMEHFIFSDNLRFPNQSDSVHIKKPDTETILNIKKTSETDIYLCGGGKFAGWLLANNLIDCLKIKLNPVLIGNGIKLFGDSTKKVKWRLTSKETYDQGLVVLTYEL